MTLIKNFQKPRTENGYFDLNSFHFVKKKPLRERQFSDPLFREIIVVRLIFFHLLIVPELVFPTSFDILHDLYFDGFFDVIASTDNLTNLLSGAFSNKFAPILFQGLYFF